MNLTAENIHEIFNYDPETGVMFWRVRDVKHFTSARAQKSFNTKYSCKEAGTTNTFSAGKRYRVITFYGRNYLTHRVIWLLQTGRWPRHCIDHINGNSLDNRIVNLRDVTQTVNCSNQNPNKRNTSGYRGVYWVKGRGKYKAAISVTKKQVHLGYFNNIQDAINARIKAEIKHGFITHTKPI